MKQSEVFKLPEGMHRADRGLYLRVDSKSRRWIFKFTLAGRRREMGLGSARDVPLAAALAAADRARGLIASGIDPIEDRRKAESAEAAESGIPSFCDFAQDCVDHYAYLRQWKNPKTKAQWESWIGGYCLPVLKDKRIDQVTRQDVIAILRPVWDTRTATASRIREVLSLILNRAVVEGHLPEDYARWKGNLDSVFPAPGVLRRKAAAHHAALTPEQLREAVAELYKEDTIAAKAVLFGIFTVGRASEFCLGKWSEVDTDANTFSVPYERRKDGRPEPHVVPLSNQAQRILEILPGGRWLFPSRGSHLSPQSLRLCLARHAGGVPVTMHGCRSTFSDWCAQHEKNFLVSEKCLMHSVGNAVFRAYQRDTLLDQRRQLLQEWADWLTRP